MVLLHPLRRAPQLKTVWLCGRVNGEERRHKLDTALVLAVARCLTSADAIEPGVCCSDLNIIFGSRPQQFEADAHTVRDAAALLHSEACPAQLDCWQRYGTLV